MVEKSATGSGGDRAGKNGLRIKETKDLGIFSKPRYQTIRLKSGETFRGHVVRIVESRFKDPATGMPRLQIEVQEPTDLTRVFVPLNAFREEFIKTLVARGILIPVPAGEDRPQWVRKEFITKQPEYSFFVRKERIYIIAIEKLTPAGPTYLVPEKGT